MARPGGWCTSASGVEPGVATPPSVGAGRAADGSAGRAPDGVLERDDLRRLHVVQALDVVLFRRPVPAALLRQHVHDDRPVPLGRVGEGLLHQVDVVPVDRPGVADAECFEEGVRGHHLSQRAGHRMHAGVGERPEAGESAEASPQTFAGLGIGRVQPQAGQALRELRDGRGVGAAVVVEDDDDAAAGVAEVVQGLVGHAAGEGAVADDRR